MCFSIDRWGARRVLFIATLLVMSCRANRSEQYSIEGDAYWKRGEVPEATESYRVSLTLNGGNTSALVGMARCLMTQQRQDEALSLFLNAVDADPSNEGPYIDAVNILLEKKEYEKATTLALGLEKTSPVRGVILQAFVLGRTGRIPEAVLLLEGLRDRFPGSASARIALSRALMAAGRARDAEGELRETLSAIDEDSLEARMVLVDACRQQKTIGSLVEEYGRLVEQNPDDAGLRLAWARTLLYGGNTERANEIAQEILKSDRASGWGNYVAGYCLLVRKQESEALPYLQTAVSVLPHEAAVLQAFTEARLGAASRQPAQANINGDMSANEPKTSLGQSHQRRISHRICGEPDRGSLPPTFCECRRLEVSRGIRRESFPS